MNISDKVTIQPPDGVRSVKPVQKPGAAPKTTPRPVPRGDRVDISDKAREMQAARKAIDQMPTVDAEKVARIKAQLKSGAYKVDGKKTAENMLAESLLTDR